MGIFQYFKGQTELRSAARYYPVITNKVGNDTISYNPGQYMTYEAADTLSRLFIKQDERNGEQNIGFQIIIDCPECVEQVIDY